MDYGNTMNDCPHYNIDIDTTGSVYFSGGEVYDSLEDHWYCADCGATVPAPDQPSNNIDFDNLPF